MAEGMHRLNVSIILGGVTVTHWTGSPATEGGALQGIDMTPVAGPPRWEYDTTGDDREQLKFNLETKILGEDATEQDAFIDSLSRGTVFEDPTISGLPSGLDWVVENATVRHNADGNSPSMLNIVLAELGATTP